MLAQFRRIADALERIAQALEAPAATVGPYQPIGSWTRDEAEEMQRRVTGRG